MNKKTSAVFKIHYSKSATTWGIALALVFDVPLFVFLFLGREAPTLFLVFMGALFAVLPALIIYVTLAGRNMSYEIAQDEVKVNFSLMKIRAPYSFIQSVEMVDLTLLLRLFGGSWPGLHWGLFKTNKGNAHVYSTRMKGTFILISLVDGRKIAITPAESEAFLERINAERSKFGTASAKDIELSEPYSKLMVYAQIAVVSSAFLMFLAYFLSVYQALPEIVPVHFSFNWTPDRWAHKSELIIMAGLATLFPALNGFLALEFGKYEKSILIFLGILFVLVEALFSGVICAIEGFI